MYRFRIKPVVVEAFQWKGNPSEEDLPPWFKEAYEDKASITFDMLTGELRVSSLNISLKVNIGDWVIRGVLQEIYVMKDGTFQQYHDKI